MAYRALFLVLLLFSLPRAGTAALYYVNPACAPNCTGTWANAYPHLQDALDVAADGDTIWIAAGTYYPTKDKDGNTTSGRTATFNLKPNLKIFGGFAGTETSIAQRDIASHPTILSGDIGTLNDKSDNAYTVVFSQSDGTDLVLDGLTIRDGNSNVSGTFTHSGGGIYLWSNTDLSIRNVTITHNYASASGGGIYVLSNSSIDVEHCNFSFNHVDTISFSGQGAGLWADASSDIVCSYSYFENNRGKNGGAIMKSNGTLDVSHCEFIRNKGHNSGGAIFMNGGLLDADIVSCFFRGNQSKAGGALTNGSAGSEIHDCIFYKNNTSSKGGAISNLSYGVGLTISNCVFSENSALYNGGAILNGSTSSTVSGSRMAVHNSTFHGNSAGTRGGAIYQGSDTGVVVNSIIWGNTANISADIHNNGNPISMKYSLSQAYGTNGVDGNVVGTDPNFSNSAVPAGPNGQWADNDDGLIVGPMSPVTHAGSNSKVFTGVTTDIAGGPRIKGSSVDMGAYEGQYVCKIGTIIYVDVNTTGFQTGGCWNNAYPSLRMALDSISLYPNVDSILVAEGTYIPDSTSRSAFFGIPSGVSILGGYATGGSATRDWIGNETILSGDIGTLSDASDNSHTILKATYSGAEATLDGFVVKDGNYSGASGSGGAGMLIENCSPSIKNCRFENNQSPLKSGGALYLLSSEAHIERCLFTENSADEGGALFGSSLDASILGCVFYDNSSENGGGAILLHDASGAELIHCTFYKNETHALGGGALLNVDNCDPTIQNCLFYGNLANNSSPGPDIYDYTGSYKGATVSGSYASVESSLTQQFGTAGVDCNILGVDPVFKNVLNVKGPDGHWFTSDDGLDLDTTSTILDKGDTLLVPPSLEYDFGGEMRVIGQGVDMGAYEGIGRCPIDSIIYVDSAAQGGRSGGCWHHAFTDLHDAIKVAVAGQQIWVAKGTYVPYLDKDNNVLSSTYIHRASFQLNDGIKMYGGFDGTEDLLEERDPALNKTILSGKGPTANESDNSHQVIYTFDVSNETLIDGFTIRDGRGARAFWTQTGGGAMYNSRSRVVVNNCIFRANTAMGIAYDDFSGAGFAGSAILNFGGQPTITNCTFINNEAKAGGAVTNIDDKNFQSDQKMYSGCNPTILNCTFENNRANNGGALAHLTTNKLGTIANCVFKNNHANKHGGAVLVGKHSRVNFTSCDFIGNDADSLGGAVMVHGQSHGDDSRPTFENCIFEDNEAGKGGGAVASIFQGSPTVINSVFVDNEAPKGGAVLCHINSHPVYTNNTFYNNSAVDAGGAVATGHKSNSRLWNCLFSENKVGSTPSSTATGADIAELSGFFYYRNVSLPVNGPEYCMTQVYAASGSYGNTVGGTVGFVSSGNPIGLDGKWRSDDDGLRLGSTSDAVDAGGDLYLTNNYTLDFRDEQRIQGKSIDVGAYESSYGTADDVYPTSSTQLQSFQGCATLTETTKYLKADFGALGNGTTDDTEAFVKAALYINDQSSASHRIKLIIEAGTYLVGKQLDAAQTWTVTEPNTSASITYTNTNRAKKGINIFHLKNAQNVTVVGQGNATIVMKSGLYFGGFDANLNPQFINSTNQPSGYHSADVGNMILLENCNCVEVKNLELDGSEDELAQLGGIYGGHSGDGYQLAYDGVFIGNSKNVAIDDVFVHNFGRDGIDIAAYPYYSHPAQDILLRKVISHNNGRQGISWTGGDTLRAIDCSFSHTGRCGNVTNSNPRAGIDIEPEGARCTYGYFKNCRSIDNAGVAMISDYNYEGWRAAQMEFEDCIFWATSSKALWPKNMRKTTFKNCHIYGTMVKVSGSEQNDVMLFEDCFISDKGPDGSRASLYDADGWALFNMGTNPFPGVDTIPWCGGGDTVIQHGNLYYTANLDTALVNGVEVYTVTDSFLCDSLNAYHYYDWDNHSNTWFKFTGCEIKLHYSTLCVMEPHLMDFATRKLGYNYPELRTFECNLFNFHSEDLQDVTGYGFGKYGGKFFNCGFYSNVFADITPVEPGTNYQAISYSSCSGSSGCPRYAFILDVDLREQNQTDGKNYFTPVTNPTAEDAPHSRIYRWIRLDYQVPSNGKF